MDRDGNKPYLLGMMLIRSFYARLTLLVALATGLSSLGFAHQSHAISLSPQIIGFLQAGGALSDVCGETGGPAAHASCEACRLGSELADIGGVSLLVIQPDLIADTALAPPTWARPSKAETGFVARGPPHLS